MVVFGKNCCIRAKWLYSDKVDVFKKNLVLWQKWLYWGFVVVLRKKWLSSGKHYSIRAKVVVFGQKWLYSVKN